MKVRCPLPAQTTIVTVGKVVNGVRAADIAIGGIDLGNDVFDANSLDAFVMPKDLPISYLMDGLVCAAIVRALDAMVGLVNLPGVGAMDVCFEHRLAKLVVGELYEKQDIGAADIAALEAVFERWQAVRHSSIALWWNQAPYRFGMVALARDAEREAVGRVERMGDWEFCG